MGLPVRNRQATLKIMGEGAAEGAAEGAGEGAALPNGDEAVKQEGL